ncbi:SixA phosphatase family protein [Zavarzinia sp. CC-PAN008]|uniref:SixA phosphatase family protein n=1 Tax=Zavarzinia sp. CC-PAN008 TaxID=3243332 RepID=UPI003F747A46
MRQILILRHAKSSWATDGLDDHDRPLNARGETAAVLMAREIARLGLVPDQVLCSTALRTRQTLAAIRSVLDPRIAVSVEPELYLATAATLVARLKALPDSVRAPLLIGHNPGLHELAFSLSGTGDAELRHQLAGKFPTAALAVVELADAPWRTLAVQSGTLAQFRTPRGLGD